MARTRKTHAPEFELPAVRMITDQELPAAEAGRRPGVAEDLLRAWKKVALQGGAGVFPGRATRRPSRRTGGSGPRSSASRRSATS